MPSPPAASVRPMAKRKRQTGDAPASSPCPAPPPPPPTTMMKSSPPPPPQSPPTYAATAVRRQRLAFRPRRRRQSLSPPLTRCSSESTFARTTANRRNKMLPTLASHSSRDIATYVATSLGWDAELLRIKSNQYWPLICCSRRRPDQMLRGVPRVPFCDVVACDCSFFSLPRNLCK